MSVSDAVVFSVPANETAVYFVNGNNRSSSLYRLDAEPHASAYTAASIGKRDKALARALLTLALEELDAFDA